jgi:hypothetical protein
MHAYGTVAAGLVDTLCTLGESRYGVPRSELLYVGALEAKELRDAGAQVPGEALLDMVSYLLERSGDRALGIRFAEATDLRTQGFWGYLFLSSVTLRQAAELLVRFQRVRHASRMSFRVEGEWAVFEREPDPNVPVALRPIVGDAFLASFCVHRRRWMPASERGPMEAWLDYPEEPHHRELRALVGGPIGFNAPCIRHRILARELDVRSPVADPHLLQLAEMRLERQLTQVLSRVPAQDLVARVRTLLAARLREGASIDQVARPLRFSVRTLRAGGSRSAGCPFSGWWRRKTRSSASQSAWGTGTPRTFAARFGAGRASLRLLIVRSMRARAPCKSEVAARLGGRAGARGGATRA